MEITILILGLCFIFKDEIKLFFKKPKPQPTHEQERAKKEYREQFDKIVNYSYEQALTKRGDE